MPKAGLAALAAVLTLSACAAPGEVQSMLLRSTLTGHQAVPGPGDLAGTGTAIVRINAVAAGALDGVPGSEDRSRRMLSHVPLGRPGGIADLTGAVLFLADPKNGYTTGHVLAVDGGWTAGYARSF